MQTAKIQATKNYRLFHRHDDENRPLNIATRRKLKESMQLYGFLKCYPIICRRDKNGKLIVKDGQHRLAIAEELGLTVYWINDDADFDVAIVNSAAKGWVNKDYALKWAANGITAYQEILDLADRFKMQVSNAAALLAGTTAFQNIGDEFKDGTFKVKDRKWAEAVCVLYSQMCEIGPRVKDNHFLAACMAVCRLPEFDSKRLIAGAERCREKLVKYGTRDGYLEMIEEVFNFGRSKRHPVKIPAQNAMRDRNVAFKKKTKTDEPTESKQAA